MTWFLMKGLLRDHNRSIFPILIVMGGVAITILANCWVLGARDNMVMTSATFDTGHVKIMTRAYADIAGQSPNDLALFGISELLSKLRQDYPEIEWVPRTKFGGLLDFPDENGETRAQGPVMGMALDLLSSESKEKERFNLEEALVQGRMPHSLGEIVISETFAQNLQVKVGEMATLISATANGSMAVQNFEVVGTVNFGIAAMDRGAMLADISDIQYALDMEDGAGECVGYFQNSVYDDLAVDRIATEFNTAFTHADDEFTPIMLTLRQQNDLGSLLDLFDMYIYFIILGLIFVMSIVLWNTGLMSGLRRYGEVGVRLAMGEAKAHVYRTLLYESILIGIMGSIVGTAVGLAASYFLQEHGIDISVVTKGAGGAFLLSNVMRAKVTPESFYIGFIPGLCATVLGTVISGIGIFRRQTSQLFKELEA